MSYTISPSYNSYCLERRVMIESQSYENEERSFVEFRRKVRSAEMLSAAMERLLRTLQFTGRLSLVVQNGQVLKSGYEEGYFRQHEPGLADRLQ
jgi:hypothetical protein